MENIQTPFTALNHSYRHFKEEQKNDPYACADELCEVIEVLARTMCKVYVQYYLQRGAPDGALNLSLLDFFSPAGQKQVQVGQWILFARLVQETLQRGDTGEGGKLDGEAYKKRLLTVSLSPSSSRLEEDAPINRLLFFRNHLFMHGSMQANPPEVEEHEALLLEQIELLSFDHLSVEPGDRGHLLRAGEDCFPAHPLFEITENHRLCEKRFSGETGKKGGRDQEKPLIYDRNNQKMLRFYSRYVEEMEGDFHRSIEKFTGEFQRENYRPYPEVETVLSKAVDRGYPFIKLAGRPMTGKSTIAAHIGTYIPEAVPFRIDYGFLSQDPGAFEAFVKREIGKLLEREPEKKGNKAPSLAELLKLLAHEGKRLVIALDNAQLAAVQRPGSRGTIMETMKSWKLSAEGDSALTFILITRYANAGALPGRQVDIPDTYSRIHQQQKEREKLLGIVTKKNPLSKPVLETLLSEEEPLPLWQLSEEVKSYCGEPVFTPKIEISLETTLADLVVKDKTGSYSIWNKLRS